MMAERNWRTEMDGSVRIAGRYGSPDTILEGTTAYEIRVQAAGVFLNARDLAEAVAAASVRAGVNLAVVDLDDPDIEMLAEQVHKAYLAECEQAGWPVRPENNVPYAELADVSKELDRASVRAVLDALKGDSDG